MNLMIYSRALALQACSCWSNSQITQIYVKARKNRNAS